MKILILVDQLYKIGGVEKVLSQKIEYWSRKGYEIKIITNENKGNSFFFSMPDNIEYIDLSVNYDRDERFLSGNNILKSIKHFFSLSKELKKFKADIIIHCNYGFDFYFLPLLKGNSVIIKEKHSSNLFNKKQGKIAGFKRFLLNKFESLYHAIVVLSDEEMRSYNAKNIEVIANPIKRAIHEPSYESHYKSVISAGRIAPIKGFERLIKIWSIVIKDNKDWTLKIYGDGDCNYIKELNDLILGYNLSSSIEICAATKNLDEVLNLSGIYAMTSLSECFPMVLLESLQAGLPIISFDCPTGPRNIIENNITGLLIQDNDLKQYAVELIKLMNDYNKRKIISENCFLASKEFEVDNIMSKWDHLFIKLLEK